MSSEQKLDAFLRQLVALDIPGTFNPWHDYDPDYDIGLDAPRVRLNNLRAYLTQRLESAKFILIAEAPGFRGAKFGGLAMTSERMLLAGGGSLFGRHPAFEGAKTRTSRPGAGRIPVDQGMIEPTASIVWSRLIALNVDPYSWVNWNAFALHPYRANDRMTNRTPTDNEVECGLPVLKAFLNVFEGKALVSVGNISGETLARLGHQSVKVRHPANGGATKFATQMQEWLTRKKAT